MPHTLCPLGSTTNDRGEGPIEPFLANQINFGSLFRMRFFVCPYCRPGGRIFQQDIFIFTPKASFCVVGASIFEDIIYTYIITGIFAKSSTFLYILHQFKSFFNYKL
jgi:hypothetical protein